MKQAYRLEISTIGIQNQDGKASPVVIPAGAILDRTNEESGFATCMWEDLEVQMLSFDLELRAALVDGGGR